MLKHVLLSFVIPLALAGCTAPPLDSSGTIDHPANPNAAEAPSQPPSQTLFAGVSGAPVSTASEPMPGMLYSTSSSQPATTRAATLYTCPMHPEVISNKPGKCPKCGMTLVLKQDVKSSNHGGHE